MTYEMETVKLSQTIFYYLLCNRELSSEQEPDLYKAYVENEEVMELVKSQGEIADCAVERYGNVIYLLPDISNSSLGYSKAELKRILCRSGATDKDYYLSMFIILTLLAEFYDGQGGRCKSKDFMKMGELQNIVSKRLSEGSEKEEELEHTGLDYQSIKEAFEALKSETKTSRSQSTKEGVINKILNFLENEGLLLYIQEDEMMKTTKKLDQLMEMKLLNKNNYERVMKALGVIKDE